MKNYLLLSFFCAIVHTLPAHATPAPLGCFKNAMREPNVLPAHKIADYYETEQLVVTLCAHAPDPQGPIACYLAAMVDPDVLKLQKTKSARDLEVLVLQLCQGSRSY